MQCFEDSCLASGCKCNALLQMQIKQQCMQHPNPSIQRISFAFFLQACTSALLHHQSVSAFEKAMQEPGHGVLSFYINLIWTYMHAYILY